MQILERLLAETAVARSRCLQRRLRLPFRLDRRIVLQPVAARSRVDERSITALETYAIAAAGIRPSCLANVELDIAPAISAIEFLLGETATLLRTMGGAAGLTGLIFALETLNFEGANKDVLDVRVQAVAHRALARLLQAFAGDRLAVELVAAGAHHCLNLVFAFSDRLDGIDVLMALAESM
jgi:hypothetical protein